MRLRIKLSLNLFVVASCIDGETGNKQLQRWALHTGPGFRRGFFLPAFPQGRHSPVFFTPLPGRRCKVQRGRATVCPRRSSGVTECGTSVTRRDYVGLCDFRSVGIHLFCEGD